jgi:hypothetical protein
VTLTSQAIQAKRYDSVVDLLKATFSVLRRYRTASNVEMINVELAFVLSHVAGPLEEEFKFCEQLITSERSNPAGLRVAFEMLHQLYRIFYCLNYVDLPSVIEDKLPFYMTQHLQHLSFDDSSDELVGDVSSLQ